MTNRGQVGIMKRKIEARMTRVPQVMSPTPRVLAGKGIAPKGALGKVILVKGTTSCLLSHLRSAIALLKCPTFGRFRGLSARMGLFFWNNKIEIKEGCSYENQTDF